MPELSSKVIIIGAGLTGSLLALFLAKKGFSVQIYEKRPDTRKSQPESGKSINLALSHRGLQALKVLGIEQEVLKEAIPMLGRQLHPLQGSQTFVQYGKDDSQFINSISRADLNRKLINEADKYENVQFYFQHAVQAVNLKEGSILIKDIISQKESVIKADVFLGADGAGSVIRRTMEQQEGYQCSTEFLEYGYKEITFPAIPVGEFAMKKNALHIWPRGSFMLIALPNLDGSFTGTLFLANQGENSFEYLCTPERLKHFFENTFPDALPLLPNLREDFFNNPTGLLGTVRCQPWHVEDKFLLIGDAAHAIVPFYGQGMNASFEDCLVFNQCLEATQGKINWKGLFKEYEQKRKTNADAIAQLAIENFYEMRDGVAEVAFLRKKELEHLLENSYEDYHSKYSLVTFHPEISYAEAHRRGNLQNEHLLKICRQAKSLDELDVHSIYEQLKQEVGF